MLLLFTTSLKRSFLCFSQTLWNSLVDNIPINFIAVKIEGTLAVPKYLIVFFDQLSHQGKGQETMASLDNHFLQAVFKLLWKHTVLRCKIKSGPSQNCFLRASMLIPFFVILRQVFGSFLRRMYFGKSSLRGHE